MRRGRIALLVHVDQKTFEALEELKAFGPTAVHVLEHFARQAASAYREGKKEAERYVRAAVARERRRRKR